MCNMKIAMDLCVWLVPVAYARRTVATVFHFLFHFYFFSLSLSPSRAKISINASNMNQYLEYIECLPSYLFIVEYLFPKKKNLQNILQSITFTVQFLELLAWWRIANPPRQPKHLFAFERICLSCINLLGLVHQRAVSCDYNRDPHKVQEKLNHRHYNELVHWVKD